MKANKKKDTDYWPFNKYNYTLFAIGLLTIFFGYFLMANGEVDSFQSVRLSPFILIVGYLIIIPLSIFYKK